MDVYFDDFFVYCTLAQKYVIFVDKKWLSSQKIHIFFKELQSKSFRIDGGHNIMMYLLEIDHHD